MTIRIVALQDLLPSLAASFAEGDGLILTGAGVSRQDLEVRDGTSVRVGVPSGERLRQHFLKHITNVPRDQSLEMLATVYEMEHGRKRLNTLIRRLYGGDQLVAPQFYALVARLPGVVRRFVTTNYDPFLERVLAIRRPVVVVRDSGLHQVAEQRPVIYKPHCDANDPAGCVITSRDYDEWESTTGHLPAQLTTLFLQTTVVAIGYQAQDANLRRLLSAVNRRIRDQGHTPRTMYVVVPNPRSEDFAAYSGPEYDLVLVPATGNDFMGWLLERLEARRRSEEAAALSRLIDPPDVIRAEAEAAALRPTSSGGAPPGTGTPDPLTPDPLWIPYGEALLRLAAAELAAQRFRPAILSRARAAQAFHRGGDERGTALHEQVYRDSLLVRRDVDLFRRAEGIMSTPNPGGQRSEPSDEAAYLAARGDINSGFPDGPPGFQAELERRLSAGPSAADVPRLGLMLDHLRAEYAVTDGNFAEAATNYNRAAVQEVSGEARQAHLIRAHLFAALSGRPDALEASWAALAVPGDFPALEGLRLRALGWVLALAGDHDAATSAFRDAAAAAIAAADTVGAAIAYRGMEWVMLQHPSVISFGDGPGQAAVRLENAADAADKRETVGSFLLRAEGALLRGDRRAAMLAACAAQRLAYDDLDPAGVFRAQPMIAAAWLATLPDVSDDFSIGWTAHYFGVAWAQLKREQQAEAAKLLHDALLAHTSPAFRRQIAVHLSEELVDRVEWIGGLSLLAAIAEVFDDATVNEVLSPAMLRALRAGRGRHSADPVGAACDLIEAVHERLDQSAAPLLQELANLMRSTPTAHLSRIYIALAQVTSRSHSSLQVIQIADELLGALRRAAAERPRTDILGSLGIALAAVAPKVDAPTRERVVRALAAEASAMRWDGIAVLAALGTEPDQSTSNAYLAHLTTLMRSHTHVADPRSFGMFGWDTGDPRLIGPAARAASAAVVAEALTAATALLSENGQWSVLRSAWVFTIVRLLLEHPERLAQVVPTLVTLARGEYREPGDFSRFDSSYPLSAMRVSTGSTVDLRGKALVGLAGLWIHLGPEVKQSVRDMISAAAVGDVPVREWAFRAVGEALNALRENATASDAGEDRRWLVDLATTGLSDPSHRVREATIHALKPESGLKSNS